MKAKSHVPATRDVTDCIAAELSDDEREYFSKNITCTEAESRIMAAETMIQGNGSRWHKERALRITSSVAHHVITRKKSFETLAEQLQRSKTPRVPAVLYGTAMEPEARRDFERKVGTAVTQVGLVISPFQPWLCASPDGLFETGAPPYFGQHRQRPEARPNDPLREADRAFIISELFLRFPAQIVSKSGVTTYFIDGCVIQESPQPFSSTTVATTTAVGGSQLCYSVRITDTPTSTMPGTDPGASGAVTVNREPPQPLDSFFVETPAMTESYPGAATSTVKMTVKPKTPSLADKETEERRQTTLSKATYSFPRATATSKSDLVHDMPPAVLSTTPQNSVASHASPALLTTPRQRQQEATNPLHNGDHSPEKWTVDYVVEYVSGIPGCEHIAEEFRLHEIDGGALFLIKEHHLIDTMNMKLGPALKMCATIHSLRKVPKKIELLVRVGAWFTVT
ncbi:hypothetical protein MRX96_014205 [Rhipicephalus microplus]